MEPTMNLFDCAAAMSNDGLLLSEKGARGLTTMLAESLNEDRLMGSMSMI